MTGPDLLGGFTPTPRPRVSTLLVALTAAGSVAVAAAGVATATVFASGGTQPEDVLPRNAVAVLKVDLDPAADQKVAAYRLSRKFPQLKTKSEGSVVSDLLRQALESSDDIDYDKDVEPWLGRRIAVAAVPEGDTVEPVVAVQYTDEEKARAGLRKLADDSEEEAAFAFVEGEDYAVLADSQALADKYARAGEHLSDNASYGDAVDELDGNQVATAWVDIAGAYRAFPQEVRDRNKGEAPRGYGVAGLHLDGSFLELTGTTIGVADGNAALTGKTALVQDLPRASVAAFGVSGAGEGLRKALTQQGSSAADALRQLEQFSGLTVAEDLPALLGSDIALAVLGGSGEPGFAARTTTDAADAALSALRDLLAEGFGGDGPQLDQLVRKAPGGLVGGTSPELVDQVLADGDLGEQEVFRKAVPDADDAGLVLFVDVQKAVALSGQDVDEVEQLLAVGLTATATGSGDGSFRLRVTFR